MRDLLNGVERLIHASEVGFQHVIAGPGGADQLAYFLAEGSRAVDERRRSRQGSP
jgi:hypothetical protein